MCGNPVLVVALDTHNLHLYLYDVYDTPILVGLMTRVILSIDELADGYINHFFIRKNFIRTSRLRNAGKMRTI